jgi:hypothetical protein
VSAAVRVQLRRTKGWKMPPSTVSVARPTRWGNPYRVGESFTAAEAVEAYREMTALLIKSRATFRDALAGLRGKNLACWCPLNQPCHADVLLELANAPEPAR